nr:MAG TPA: hypothetical protein [Caudoviricetes sp.]
MGNHTCKFSLQVGINLQMAPLHVTASYRVPF